MRVRVRIGRRPVFDVLLNPTDEELRYCDILAQPSAASAPAQPAPGATPGIAPEVADKAPFFSGRLIRGVRNGPSPDWLQKRLTAIGLRPISALVDITNLFTFDLNRPLHVFDVARISDGPVATWQAEVALPAGFHGAWIG